MSGAPPPGPLPETADDASAAETAVATQLAGVQAAIDAVQERGQEFWVKDRKLRRADLEALDKRAERLERKAARAGRGGVRIQRVIPL